MKMIAGAILILAGIIGIGFGGMRDLFDSEVPTLLGLAFLVAGVVYLVAGTMSDGKKK